MSEMLRDDEVSIERIEALAKQAFIRTDRDREGDLILREDGVGTIVKIDTERKILTLFTIWELRSGFSIDEKLNFVNSLNNSKILVRFMVPNPDTLYCEYAFLYEGGVTPFNIINTYKRFVAVCKGAIYEDEKNMVGGD